MLGRLSHLRERGSDMDINILIFNLLKKKPTTLAYRTSYFLGFPLFWIFIPTLYFYLIPRVEEKTLRTG